MDYIRHYRIKIYSGSDVVPGKTYIQSIVRAITILNLFENYKELSLHDITGMMNLNKTTVYGILDTLVHLKYLEKNEQTNMYRLGLGLFRTSQHIDIDLVRICKPYLQEMVAEFGETANLIVLENTGLMYLDKVESPHSMRICTQIGQRIPVHCSSAGKAILAHLPEDKMMDIVNNINFERLTSKTIVDKDVFVREVIEARKRGFAKDVEEFENDLLCVGVPILDHKGYPIAAMSISSPINRTDNTRLHTMANTLMATVKKVGAQLSE